MFSCGKFRLFRLFQPGVRGRGTGAALVVLLALVLALAGCGGEPTIYRIGAVHPLTGDGASYGLPVERVIERAVADVNEQWAAEERRISLEVVMADGKCNAGDALAAARRLVEEEGVKLIYGGTCSDETLGMAPYTEANEVLLLSPLSGSTEISGAGDYVFRNIPSNADHVATMTPFLLERGFRRFALLTNDTAFAQDLRGLYRQFLPKGGGEIVADEVVPSGAGEYSGAAARIVAAKPDLVLVLPQTAADIGFLLTYLRAAGYAGPGASNAVAGAPAALAEYGELLEGFYVPAVRFKGEGGQPYFEDMQLATDCDWDFYCATAYDGVELIGEMLPECGDQDAVCMRDFLYGTQGWEGKYFGVISFDTNGDVSGDYRINQIREGVAGPPGPITYRIGTVHPLTGNGAGYGLPVERVIERAVADINEQWAADNRQIEVIAADGKCNSVDALAAARRLVEEEGVKIIYGGSCSDETLGIAPYAEANRILQLTPLSTASAVSEAGDYVFRNIPGNAAAVRATVAGLPAGEFQRFALFSNDTAYARDLREWFARLLREAGGEIVADELVPSGEGDYRAAAGRIVAAEPDLVVALPQTFADIGYLLTPLQAAGYEGVGVSNLVAGAHAALAEYGDLLEGFYIPSLTFKTQGQGEFAALQGETDCDLDHYCAIAYDGTLLLAEMLLECGDRDTACMRDFLYGTQDWEGKYYGVISFDANGDVGGSFRMNRVVDGELMPLER